ncbi:ribonuclease H-like domain-containing protein [Halobacterium wangiae]|uniref:ribonuclease H-like domain-containing protein n=1 Tax=Halobacterium wangiae TaxID=2902623 RepID=UPI001E53C280|nr:ribonuclease H-like domain-containing protein [Halobacterium wangiae]
MRVENSFLPAPGVGETTERRLWEHGVTHWDEFAGDGPGVGDATAENIYTFIEEARAALDTGDTRYFADVFPNNTLWRLYENVAGDVAFFDIETTGLDKRASDVTTVSVHHAGDTTTLVQGHDLTSENLVELLDASLLVSFNGKRFDAPFLEYNFDCSFDAPHLDLMYLCKRLDLDGGLKQVERDLGIDRGGMDVDGREAVRLWHRYESGDEAALDRLVEYNRYDAQNLETLLDTVTGRLHEHVFEPHC